MSTILHDLRIKQGQDAAELAAAAGISIESYWDLENHDDELRYAIPVGGVVRLARKLAVNPSSLYRGTSNSKLSADELAALIRNYLAKTGKSLAQFETDVGWSIAPALKSPALFAAFNADCLDDVRRALNVNWLDFLDHL